MTGWAGWKFVPRVYSHLMGWEFVADGDDPDSEYLVELLLVESLVGKKEMSVV